MKAKNEGISVAVLGKELTVACPPEERDSLIAAARYLDGKMREISDSGKVIGAERCALMAGLNISHELLQARTSGAASNSGWAAERDRRLKYLSAKIDDVLRQELGQQELSGA